MADFGKARVPTEAELKRLLSVTRAGAHSTRNAGILAVSYRLGLRAKEIASLRIKDVLGEDGRLLDDCTLTAAMTKGGKPRIVYLSNQSVRQTLRQYIDERTEREDIVFNVEAPLFRSQKGNSFSPNSMQQLMRRLHDNAGILGGRSHSGRRWFATELIGKGVDLKAVATLAHGASAPCTTTTENQDLNVFMPRQMFSDENTLTFW